MTTAVSPALPAGSAAATTAEDRDDGKNQERRVANDAHYAAVQELKSFVQDFDFHSIQSLAPLKDQGEPSIVQLQEDDLCNAADFIKELHRNFVAEELRTPDGMHMRREYLCSDPPEDSTANDITYSFTVDNPDAGATENDDDKEENDELPPLTPRTIFSFDIISVNRPFSFLSKAIIASVVDTNGWNGRLRRVRGDDDVCYAKSKADALLHCAGTLYEKIVKGAEAIGLCCYRSQIYGGGYTLDYQDYRWHESDLIVKIGGFFYFRRGCSFYNKKFLKISKQHGAVCINTTDSFHQGLSNPYYHAGGGDGDAITLIFRSVDGMPIAQEQSVQLMAFLYSLDCKLEETFYDKRTHAELLSQIDICSLKQWEISDAHTKAHFTFMVDYILSLGGAKFIQGQKRRKDLRQFRVYSPSKGAVVSVRGFLESVEKKFWERGASAFTEDELSLLRKIGLREERPFKTRNFFESVNAIIAYQEEHPSFDINDPTQFNYRTDIRDGTLVQVEGYRNPEQRACIGFYFNKKRSQLRRNALQPYQAQILTDLINLSPDYRTDPATMDHYNRLIQYKLEGGDINTIGSNQTLIPGPEGKLVLDTRLVRGEGKYQMDGGSTIRSLHGRGARRRRDRSQKDNLHFWTHWDSIGTESTIIRTILKSNRLKTIKIIKI